MRASSYLLLLFSASALVMAILAAVEAADGSMPGCCMDDRPALITFSISFLVLAVFWALAAINLLWIRRYSTWWDALFFCGILTSASSIVVAVIVAQFAMVLAIVPLIFSFVSLVIVVRSRADAGK